MTQPTISEIVAALQDVVGAVTGIRSAPDIPPEQMAGAGVVAWVYPQQGTFREITSGQEEGVHTLALLIGTPRTNLRTDWGRIIGLGDTVARAILNGGSLTSTVLQTNGLRYTFGDLDWGGQQLFGWMFEVEVLTSGSLT